MSEVTSVKTGVAEREPERRQLAADVEAYLKRGGVIEEIPVGVTAYARCAEAMRRTACRITGANAPRTHREKWPRHPKQRALRVVDA